MLNDVTTFLKDARDAMNQSFGQLVAGAGGKAGAVALREAVDKTTPHQLRERRDEQRALREVARLREGGSTSRAPAGQPSSAASRLICALSKREMGHPALAPPTTT